MIHHSCDRCRRSIDSRNEIRYVVQIEAHAAVDSMDLEFDGQQHMDELKQILENLDEDQCDELRSEAFQSRHYDLCHECYNQYIRDPLQCGRPVQMGFSRN